MDLRYSLVKVLLTCPRFVTPSFCHPHCVPQTIDFQLLSFQQLLSCYFLNSFIFTNICVAPCYFLILLSRDLRRWPRVLSTLSTAFMPIRPLTPFIYRICERMPGWGAPECQSRMWSGSDCSSDHRRKPVPLEVGERFFSAGGQARLQLLAQAGSG